MERTMCVAKTLYDMYYEKYGMHMDQMKMHKLMYFAQRESLMYNNEPLFDGTFYGWKYGPVLKEVRSLYMTGVCFSDVQGFVSCKTKEMLENVLERYGTLTSWKLSSLSHEEFSWKKARTGLAADDDGNVRLSLDAMRVDATRELMNRKTETV